MDMMIFQSNDYKVCNTSLPNQLSDDTLTVRLNINNEIDTSGTMEIREGTKKTISTIDYEKMLYFVCNLCPYLCIKDSKITEHLETVHKDNKIALKPIQLKCPACSNIFFRNMSLKSHLVHDHKVANTDLRQIIQAVVYYAKKSYNTAIKSSEVKNGASKVENAVCKSEGLRLIETVTDSEKVVDNEHNCSKELDTVKCKITESTEEVESVTNIVPEKNLEVLNNIELGNVLLTTILEPLTSKNDIKTLDVSSKFLNLSLMQKCTVAQCKVRMKLPDNIDYHIKCHVETTFKCLECNNMFAFWKPLTAHLWRVHKIDMELYACDKCDYKSPSLGKINNIHKLIHSDVRAYECDTCKKKFKNSKQLRNHKLTHKDKAQKLVHICDMCSKRFSDKRQLNVHMDVVHKKIKPFLCSYCGYKGASKSSLKMHMRQHTGEKPFSCDVCEYSTSDHNSLRRHKLRHTGQKPYKCLHCKYSCIQASTYKEHIRTKHPGVEKDFVFTCPECQFRTVNQEMYVSHLFLVHQRKPT